MCAYKLDNISTRAPEGMEKELIQKETKEILEKLEELQNLLYAEKKHSVLIVIQGMDASGKDGAIRNVCRGINPLGVMVKSFKAPTPEEYAHDFLCHKVTGLFVPLQNGGFHNTFTQFRHY